MRNVIIPLEGNAGLRLYDGTQIARVLAELVPQWQEQEANLTPLEKAMVQLAQRLEKGVPWRRLVQVEDLWSWQSLEQRLKSGFPHFEPVTQLLREAVYLSYRSRSALQLPPLLLLGDPGVGKTFYAQTVAKSLNLEFRVLPMATVTAGFLLSGMDARWSDARAGLLFQQLVQGQTANPLILLDEIDKSGDDQRHDPLGPLYGLLERHTARRFEDEYFPLPLDASRVQWIATANDLGQIPEPIVSRMHVIEVPKPSLEQRRALVSVLYQHLLEEQSWGWIFAPGLSAELIAAIAERCETPREIRRTLERLCGSAACRGGVTRFDVLGEDPVDLGLPDLSAIGIRQEQKPGFGFRAARAVAR